MFSQCRLINSWYAIQNTSRIHGFLINFAFSSRHRDRACSQTATALRVTASVILSRAVYRSFGPRLTISWTGSRESEPTGAHLPREGTLVLAGATSCGACKTRRRVARACVCLWRPWRESAFVLSHTPAYAKQSVSLDFAPLLRRVSSRLLTFLRKSTDRRRSACSIPRLLSPNVSLV